MCQTVSSGANAAVVQRGAHGANVASGLGLRRRLRRSRQPLGRQQRIRSQFGRGSWTQKGAQSSRTRGRRHPHQRGRRRRHSQWISLLYLSKEMSLIKIFF